MRNARSIGTKQKPLLFLLSLLLPISGCTWFGYAPDAPSNVSVTATSCTSFKVTWSMDPSNRFYYELFYTVDGSAPTRTHCTEHFIVGSTNEYSFKPFSFAYQPIVVSVIATNYNIDSPLSRPVTATPLVPSVINAFSDQSGNLTVQWTPVPGATKYNLYYQEGPAEDSCIPPTQFQYSGKFAALTQTTYTFQATGPGYFAFRVSGLDSSAAEGGLSAPYQASVN